MGVYSVSEYGSGTYGAILPSKFAVAISIRPMGYDGLYLSWNPPSGNWSDLMLVRSSYGYPMSVSDGTPLVDEPKATAPTSLLDNGLRSGRFYYYTLFVYATDDARWVPAARTTGLVVVDHDHDTLLWDLLPAVYKARDIDYRGAFEDGPLRRFMGLFGYQVDRIRSEAETLLNVSAIDRVAGGLLPVLADSLGTTYEPQLGMRISRGLVKNAIHLAKTKGTLPGIEGVASAYTDFGATAVVGKNLLLDRNHSGWVEDTVSHWEATGATLDNHLPGAYTAAVADTGTLRIVAAGGGDAVARSGTYASQTLIPVAASTDYTASVYVRHAGAARTVTVGLVFYDADGAGAVATEETPAANTAAWVRRTVTATSPATARWAAIRVTVAGALAAEEHLVSAAQLEAGTVATTWGSGRQVHIYLDPRRANLVPNPSLEVDTSGWLTAGNSSMVRTTAEAFSGTASLEVTSLAAGNPAVSTLTGTSGIPVVAGEPYTLSAYVKAASTPRACRVTVRWYDGAGASISTHLGTNVNDSTSEWTRLSLTETAPANAAYATVFVTIDSVAAGGEVHYVDAVLFEQTEFLKDYFDASLFPPSDYLWAGTAHNSASHLYPRRALKDERLTAVLPQYIPAGVDFQTHYGESVPASSI